MWNLLRSLKTFHSYRVRRCGSSSSVLLSIERVKLLKVGILIVILCECVSLMIAVYAGYVCLCMCTCVCVCVYTCVWHCVCVCLQYVCVYVGEGVGKEGHVSSMLLYLWIVWNFHFYKKIILNTNNSHLVVKLPCDCECEEWLKYTNLIWPLTQWQFQK